MECGYPRAADSFSFCVSRLFVFVTESILSVTLLLAHSHVILTHFIHTHKIKNWKRMDLFLLFRLKNTTFLSEQL